MVRDRPEFGSSPAGSTKGVWPSWQRRLVLSQEIVGSIPTTPATTARSPTWQRPQPEALGSVGSNPIARTTIHEAVVQRQGSLVASQGTRVQIPSASPFRLQSSNGTSTRLLSGEVRVRVPLEAPPPARPSILGGCAGLISRMRLVRIQGPGPRQRGATWQTRTAQTRVVVGSTPTAGTNSEAHVPWLGGEDSKSLRLGSIPRASATTLESPTGAGLA